MRNYTGTRKGINVQLQSSVYLFDISFAIKKFSFCGAIFKSILAWERGIELPKGSSQNQVVRLLVIFHLPYIKCMGVKICFYSCHYQNQNFSLVLHSCRSCRNRAALASFIQHSCHACVALVSLVSHSCCTRFARVWRSCCKLDQIVYIFVYKIFINSIFKSYTAIAMGFHAQAK